MFSNQLIYYNNIQTITKHEQIKSTEVQTLGAYTTAHAQRYMREREYTGNCVDHPHVTWRTGVRFEYTGS